MRKISMISLLAVLFLGLFFSKEAFAEKKAWAPYKGTSEVTQNGTRQSFTFTWAAINKFDSSSTFEVETQVSEKYFANYDNSKKDNWFSDLPHSYLDTKWSDCWPVAKGSIDNFTVGSAEARLIEGKKEYTTYMKLKPESVKKSTVRVRGQKGYRLIDFYGYPLRYDPTTNIFPSETTYPDYLCLLNAPATSSWSY